MGKRFTVDLELPDELADALGDETLKAKAKEALVMELLREHRLSQGKAAEILAIRREEIFALMTRYQVPVVNLSADELDEELSKPFPAR